MFNVGIIGLRVGEHHMRAYSAIPDVRILAIADINESRLKQWQAHYHVPQAYTDYRDLLAVPEVDGVSICLPNHLHAPVTIEALRAGKHVLVEKPIATSTDDAERMIATAAACQKTLAVRMNYRWQFGPDSLYLKQIIDQGRLGGIYYAKAVSLRRGRFLRGYDTWFTDKERSGGGALIDMGPHLLDLAMWLLNDFWPLSVSCVTRQALMPPAADVEDFASALIRMKGGAAIAIESTWESFAPASLSLTLLGTKGGAVFDLLAGANQRLTLIGADDDTVVETRPVDIHLAPVTDVYGASAPARSDASAEEHFVRSILRGQKPETAAEGALPVMRILEAAYTSSASGREVAIQDNVQGALTAQTLGGGHR